MIYCVAFPIKVLLSLWEKLNARVLNGPVNNRDKTLSRLFDDCNLCPLNTLPSCKGTKTHLSHMMEHALL